MKPDGHSVQVIAPVNLQILPGKIYALLGPSGSGKSSLLRILSGLAQPSSGQILSHGRPLNGQLPNVQIVFQSFALFPWLTVLQNVVLRMLPISINSLRPHWSWWSLWCLSTGCVGTSCIALRRLDSSWKPNGIAKGAVTADTRKANDQASICRLHQRLHRGTRR